MVPFPDLQVGRTLLSATSREPLCRVEQRLQFIRRLVINIAQRRRGHKPEREVLGVQAKNTTPRNTLAYPIIFDLPNILTISKQSGMILLRRI
jgi:hypothetical protein